MAALLGAAQRLTGNGPTIDLDLTRGALPSWVTFSRSSTRTIFDATGTLQYLAAGLPGLNASGLLVEETRTNAVRNPRAEGAATGTPGTAPTNWTLAATANGIATSVVGAGTEYGMPYIDIRKSGTTTASAGGGNPDIVETNTQIAASNGQAWTGSVYMRLVGGSLANVTTMVNAISQRNSSGGLVADLNSGAIAPTATMQRFANYQLLSGGASVAYVNLKLLAITYSSGVAIDFTMRVYLPQMEQGAFATSPILPPAGSPAATTRAADFAYVGGAFSPIGSVAFDFMPLQQSGTIQYAGQIDDGTDSNRVGLSIGASGSGTSVTALLGGSTVASQSLGNVTFGAVNKLATSFQPLLIMAASNGSGFSVGGIRLPTLKRIVLGQAEGLNRALNGYVRRVRYWPRPLANSELLGVTR